MEQVIALLDMGKHTAHVWGAYGASLVILVGIAVYSVTCKTKALRKLSRRKR